MDCRDREGRRVEGGEGQDRFLRGLYGTRGGRVCVKLLIQPWVSKLGGRVLNSRLSRVGIPRFIEKNKIDMSQYEERSFRSYNDFFMRRIKPEMRPVSMEATRLISPCDSRLTVHEITESSCFAIKGTMYTMESLLRDKALARVYDGGTLLLFRLTVDDYHRYCYVDSGQKSKITGCPVFIIRSIRRQRRFIRFIRKIRAATASLIQRILGESCRWRSAR